MHFLLYPNILPEGVTRHPASKMFSREAKNRVDPNNKTKNGRIKGRKSFRAAWETLLASQTQSSTEKKGLQSGRVRFRRGRFQDESPDSSDTEYYDRLNTSVHSTNGSVNLSGSYSKSKDLESIWTSSARRLKDANPSNSFETKTLPIEGEFQFHARYPPIQENLVSKICEGEYVNFQELLPENLADEYQKSNRQLVDDTERIEDITKWVDCLAVYIAIYSSVNPQRVRDMLAYQSNVTKLYRESQDKKAWQRYDVAFRRRAFLKGLKDWSAVDENLWIFACSRDARKPLLCKPCLSVAHDMESCPLNARNITRKKAEMTKKRGLW